jgi:hypothetical protein
MTRNRPYDPRYNAKFHIPKLTPEQRAARFNPIGEPRPQAHRPTAGATPPETVQRTRSQFAPPATRAPRMARAAKGGLKECEHARPLSPLDARLRGNDAMARHGQPDRAAHARATVRVGGPTAATLQSTKQNALLLSITCAKATRAPGSG